MKNLWGVVASSTFPTVGGTPKSLRITALDKA